MPHHREQLHASAITDEVIGRRGYGSVMRPTAGNSEPRALLKRLRFPAWARDEDTRYPGLLFPLFSPLGERAGWQYRPDSRPRDPETGKARRYAYPVGQPPIADVHPLSRDAIIDPSVPLWVCEGIKKGDALRSLGQCAVALGGVYNWRSRFGTLGDWENILLRAGMSASATTRTSSPTRWSGRRRSGSAPG
jgi:hypothetical protein